MQYNSLNYKNVQGHIIEIFFLQVMFKNVYDNKYKFFDAMFIIILFLMTKYIKMKKYFI